MSSGPRTSDRVAVRSAIINVMGGAALKAARGLLRDFGEVEQLQVSVKGPGDFVSTADLRAEKILRTELTKARPGYGLPARGRRRRAGQRSAPSLDRRSARRHDQFPARHPAFRHLDRARARWRDRRRDGLRAGARRDVLDRERRRRLSQRSPPARLRPARARRCLDRHRHAVRAGAATATPISPRSPR